ncbi:urease accessory protein UreD [Skermania piniformis]|uniref:Urease accessory protein UreD n=1 Tax=Skermania pinensis TaxID=39122 RepID=A0ABX8SD84_9ACTN|nr:urease accessory protein UreD [Skermania piniformis]
MIAVDRAEPRAVVDLRGGTLVPRLIDRTHQHVRVALVAGGALLLPGDRVRLRVRVGADCHLELADIGGTVAYGSPAGVPESVAEWRTDIVVGAGGSLVWHGLPFVVADRAHVRRTTTLTLCGGDATALVRETLVLGRTGESGGRIGTRTSVTRAGTPVLVEQLDVAGAEPTPGILGTARVLDTVLAMGFPMAADPAAAETVVLALDSKDALVRWSGSAAHHSPLPRTRTF